MLLGCGGAPAEGPPNVLVLLLDDVGVDGVSAYAQPGAPPTPTLDGLAAQGVRFTRAYAYPVCAPSRAALLTGRYGRRHGLGDNVGFDGSRALPDSEETLAEVARRAGYATAVFGKWHLSVRSEAPLQRPHDHGFDHFVGMIGNFEDTVEPRERPLGYTRWERVDNGRTSLETGYATSVVVDATLAWIGAQADAPWLALVGLPAAHGPMHVPPASLLPAEVAADAPEPAQFRAIVQAADAELGRLLDGLDPAVRARTLVVVAGDNGTDDARDPDGFDVLGGKDTLYEGGVRVPLVVAGAGVDAPGVHEGLVHLVDLMPTAASAMGATSEADLDGRNLWPVLAEPAGPGVREALYLEQFGPPGPVRPFPKDFRAVIEGDRKLIAVVPEGRWELTTVRDSPADEERLAFDDPDSLDADDAAAFARLSKALDERYGAFSP